MTSAIAMWSYQLLAVLGCSCRDHVILVIGGNGVFVVLAIRRVLVYGSGRFILVYRLVAAIMLVFIVARYLISL